MKLLKRLFVLPINLLITTLLTAGVLLIGAFVTVVGTALLAILLLLVTLTQLVSGDDGVKKLLKSKSNDDAGE